MSNTANGGSALGDGTVLTGCMRPASRKLAGDSTLTRWALVSTCAHVTLVCDAQKQGGKGDRLDVLAARQVSREHHVSMGVRYEHARVAIGSRRAQCRWRVGCAGLGQRRHCRVSDEHAARRNAMCSCAQLCGDAGALVQCCCACQRLIKHVGRIWQESEIAGASGCQCVSRSHHRRHTGDRQRAR
jgi:hypothetical protein